MIVGIDIGGSTTDAVLLEEPGMRVVTIELTDPVAAAAGALGKLVNECGLRLEQITGVAATGAGARGLPDTLLGRPVFKVDEFTAIGVGGSSLAGKESALVVSLGTGTAIVSVRGNKIEHVGGTGVGGGTLLGLARHMLGVSKITTLEAMAGRGDLSRINLTVGDIAGLAIINMIAEVVAVVSLSHARAHGHRDIVLTGKLTRTIQFVRRFPHMKMMFDRGFVIPEHAAYATAIGAARAGR
jgi:type II pantothenate kinase